MQVLSQLEEAEEEIAAKELSLQEAVRSNWELSSEVSSLRSKLKLGDEHARRLSAMHAELQLQQRHGTLQLQKQSLLLEAVTEQARGTTSTAWMSTG